MNRKIIVFIFVVLGTVSVALPSVKSGSINNLKGPYMGQKAPVDKAGVFLDGIISTLDKAEMCAGFTRDGKEFYYNAHHKNKWTIFTARVSAQGWTKPVPLDFTAGYVDRDFTLSPDGNKIYFGSNRPREKGGPVQSALDIFVSRRLTAGKWSQPEALGPAINTDSGENYPCVTANGNLYFFSCRSGGIGGCDIYMSRWVNGKYVKAKVLDSAVNSDKNDWDAYIAPDESYIIFSSQNRSDTLGGQDLYISFRNSSGAWSKAMNMGPKVNSAYAEICPSVSLDGKYFFFTSRRRGKADIFWMTVDVIEKMRKK